MINKKHTKKATAVYHANFRMYGIGNFDISVNEFAEILEALDKENYDFLVQIYERLERKRLG